MTAPTPLPTQVWVDVRGLAVRLLHQVDGDTWVGEVIASGWDAEVEKGAHLHVDLSTYSLSEDATQHVGELWGDKNDGETVRLLAYLGGGEWEAEVTRPGINRPEREGTTVRRCVDGWPWRRVRVAYDLPEPGSDADVERIAKAINDPAGPNITDDEIQALIDRIRRDRRALEEARRVVHACRNELRGWAEAWEDAGR